MKNNYKLLLPLFLVLFIMCQPPASNDVILTNSQVDSLMNHVHENGMFNGTILVSEY